MSAEVLREAAAAIREDVKAMPVQAEGSGQVRAVYLNSRAYLVQTPTFALAVAEQMDRAAVIANWEGYVGVGPMADVVRAATETARAYLAKPQT